MTSVWILFLAAVLSAQRQTLPEFVVGDQCLFCHRNDIGPTWQKNAHGVTVTPNEADPQSFTIGRTRKRPLKKSGYGKFAIQEPDGSWNQTKFADRCAGCHTTAVDAQTKAFAQFGIDCYACHGVVDLDHTGDTKLILLSKKNRGDARQITSICASCHLRGGRSKTTGLPYPFHYVAGDDLFADWQADLSKADDASLNAGDRHIYRNVRGVLQNNSDVNCLTCHAVHANSTQKHRRVLTSSACNDCHNATGPKKDVKRWIVSSPLCEY